MEQPETTAQTPMREQLERRRAQLKQERDKSWLPTWKELRDYIEPNSGRFDDEETNDGIRRDQKIINNCATTAAGVLEAGMQSGMTNPAIPWYDLKAPDPGLNEFGPVQNWLWTVKQVMSGIFTKSNLYNALPTCYGEQGIFGQGVICALPDPETVVRFYNFTVGSYMLATSSRQIVDVLYRDFHMTPRQMAQQFGKAKLSPTVKNLLDKGTECWIKICHAIEPNTTRDASMKDNQNMLYRSVYWEAGSDRETLLRSSGFKRFPVMAPRWKVKGENVYGKGPGSVCIGEVKALQKMEVRAAQMLDKGVNPPMAAPASMRNQRLSILPGDVNYIADSQFGSKMAPLYEVNPSWYTGLTGKMQEHERRIDEAFFVDLFLMISRMDTVRTATEIVERKQEKMVMLGPVLERQNDELLDPLIALTFELMLEQSVPRWQGILPGAPLIPPPPKELAGMDLNVDYTSILAQAQKAMGSSNIERAVGFCGQMAESFPQTADNLDPDMAVREYFDSIGTNPKILRTADQVEAIRQGRAEQEQQAATEAQMAQVAQGAKLLSEADMAGDNALTRMIGQ